MTIISTVTEHTSSPVNRLDRERSRRRMAMLRRTGLFGSDTNGATITRILSLGDYRDAYRLVHDIFLDCGYIFPQPGGMRIRPYEAVSDLATFVAKANGKIVGVLSVVEDSLDMGLPSDLSFQDELNALREQGLKLCEGTNQVLTPDFRKTAVSTELMRCGVAHSLWRECDEIVVAISPSHMRFYEIMGFRSISPVRNYSTTIEDPVVVMSLDTHELRHRSNNQDEVKVFIKKFLYSENPFIARVGGWAAAMSCFFEDSRFLRQLFINEARIHEEFTDQQIETVFYRWGNRLRRQVMQGMLEEALY